MSSEEILAQVENDPSIVSQLIRESEASVEELKQNIQTKSGIAVIDFIIEYNQQLKKSLSDLRSFNVIKAAADASFWINEKIKAWLREKNLADTHTQSVSNNITYQLGFELLELADIIRT